MKLSPIQPHFSKLSRAFSLCPLIATLSAVFVLATIPCHSQIVFKNETRRTSVWKSIYSRLPFVWKANLRVTVREVPDSTMTALTEAYENLSSRNDESQVDGLFIKNRGDASAPARIYLSDTLRGESIGLVFVHEYGHFVWHSMLSATQRNRFKRLWNEQYEEGVFVTPYAETSVEEGFAEAFSYFIRRPEELRRRDFRSLMFLTDLQDQRETVITFTRNKE